MPSRKKPYKRAGRRKLSDYNKLQKVAWKIYKAEGKKITFGEAAKEISKVYKEYKQLPDSERKFYSNDQAESMVRGLYNYINLVQIELPTDTPWFSFSDSVSSVKGFNSDFTISVSAEDSNYGGSFNFTTTISELRSEIRNSGLYSYLSSHNAFRDSDYIPKFFLVERDGNKSALYELVFNGVDKSAYPTGYEQPEAKDKYSSSSEDFKLQESKRLEAEAQDRVANGAIYLKMYEQGIISKEEFKKRMGF